MNVRRIMIPKNLHISGISNYFCYLTKVRNNSIIHNFFHVFLFKFLKTTMATERKKADNKPLFWNKNTIFASR